MEILFEGNDAGLLMTNSGGGRKPGLHLSDITRRMAFEKDKKLNPDSPMDAMVLERGFNWETVLERSLSARHKRPGYRPEQIQEDGIWMSPDWINEEEEPLVEEWKCTKKSLNKGFEGVSWHWLPNCMAYLRAALRRGWTKKPIVRFRLWWMNGTYSFESKTSDYLLLNDYWRYDVEFSRREIEENWDSIISNGHRYGLLKKTKDEDTCQPTTSQKRKPSSNPPTRSPGKVLNGTFPTGRTRNRSSSDS